MPFTSKKIRKKKSNSFLEYLVLDLGVSTTEFYRKMEFSRQAFWQAATGPKARKHTTCEFLVQVGYVFGATPESLFRKWLRFKGL